MTTNYETMSFDTLSKVLSLGKFQIQFGFPLAYSYLWLRLRYCCSGNSKYNLDFHSLIRTFAPIIKQITEKLQIR